MTPKDIILFHALILHEFQPKNTPDKTGDFAVPRDFVAWNLGALRKRKQ
jgi:hypothetical protein